MGSWQKKSVLKNGGSNDVKMMYEIVFLKAENVFFRREYGFSLLYFSTTSKTFFQSGSSNLNAKTKSW